MNNECLRCGYEWEPKIENPKCCPGCKSPAWNRPKVSSRVATRAQGIVAAAIKSGELKRQPCEACGEVAEAHHEDYAKPLEVRWLCSKHHKQHHVEIGGPLMGGDLNLRNLPEDLVRALKLEAEETGQTLRQVCMDWLGFTFRRGQNLKRDIAERVQSSKPERRLQTDAVATTGGKVTIAREAPKTSASDIVRSLAGVGLASNLQRPVHDAASCRLPGCGMCAAAKGGK